MGPSAPPKAVLDANVLARFLIKPTGASARLLKAIRGGAFFPVLSEAILHEVSDVLRRPQLRRYIRFSHDDLEAALDAFRQISIVVPGNYEVFVVEKDPKDNPILACALEGGADYLVTDDRKHLLPLKHWRGVQIVSVPGFLRILRER